MSSFTDAQPSIRPSFGYLLSLAAALVGLVCMSTGLGGALIGRSGGDPIDALNSYTIVTFVGMYGLAFAMRLIFWRSAPAALRRAVRLLLIVVFVAAMPLSVTGLILSISMQATMHHGIAIYFSVIAVACQVGSLIWLFRYRHEGL